MEFREDEESKNLADELKRANQVGIHGLAPTVADLVAVCSAAGLDPDDVRLFASEELFLTIHHLSE